MNWQIPEDRNLSIAEIDANLLKVNELITNTIESNVPIYKMQNSTFEYLNRKIKKLQKMKASLVSILNDLHFQDPFARRQVTQTAKTILRTLRDLIHTEFKKSSDKYWSNQIKQIDYRDSVSFFPKINRILRPRQQLCTEDMHIEQDKQDLLSRSSCALDNIPLVNNKFIFSSPVDKLNIIGSFYDSINSPR